MCRTRRTSPTSATERTRRRLVYNFALPPLVLHALARRQRRCALAVGGDPGARRRRASTFFNFLASHDGIGLNPARGILAEAEIDALVGRRWPMAGLVSYAPTRDGIASPYELNINYFDALSDPRDAAEIAIDRFVGAQAIMLVAAGRAGDLLPQPVRLYGVAREGRASREATAPSTARGAIWPCSKASWPTTARGGHGVHSIRRLLEARAAHPAFHPGGARVSSMRASRSCVRRPPMRPSRCSACTMSPANRKWSSWACGISSRSSRAG